MVGEIIRQPATSLSSKEGADIVFVVEVTPNFKKNFEEMKESYIRRIVE